jgi:hypothetical protein
VLRMRITNGGRRKQRPSLRSLRSTSAEVSDESGVV